MAHRPAESSRLGIVMTAALLVCAVLVGAPVGSAQPPPPPLPTTTQPAPKPPKRLCEAQEVAVERVEQAIAQHNARPNVFDPRQRAAYEAYNAEARRLNQEYATAKDNLRRCVGTVQRLADVGLSAQASPRQIDSANAAKNKVPPGYTLPYPSGGKQGYSVPRQSPARKLYEVMREISPPSKSKVTGPLQGQSRPAVGDRDPAYPGGRIGKDAKGGSAVSLDHVVPLAELFHMPGFLALTPEYMIMVANAALDLQWLSFSANRAKGSRSIGDILGVDPNWQTAQVALENRVRAELMRVIQDLLEFQGGG
ncbi:hypothetical protein [Nocardia abscessus]|uniref:hypothetical protein n=1 Tax=Nocardia abscessus TaxID=120957 RepID=UPI002456AE6B|nr:hypothetical protein [Nocardia abscessus]